MVERQQKRMERHESLRGRTAAGAQGRSRQQKCRERHQSLVERQQKRRERRCRLSFGPGRRPSSPRGSALRSRPSPTRPRASRPLMPLPSPSLPDPPPAGTEPHRCWRGGRPKETTGGFLCFLPRPWRSTWRRSSACWPSRCPTMTSSPFDPPLTRARVGLLRAITPTIRCEACAKTPP